MMLIKKLLMFACAMSAHRDGHRRRRLSRSPKPGSGSKAIHGRLRRQSPQATTKEVPQDDDIDRLARRLLDAARQRYDAQRAYYEEGRITIDRFVDASKQLELAELRLAKTDADRLAIRQRHLDRIKQI